MISKRYSFNVYSKAHCPQCDATKKWLKDRGVPFVELNAMNYRDELIGQGMKQAPGVELCVDGNPVFLWGGHRPSLMEEILKTIPSKAL